jgi:hypothetical protein
MCQETGDAGKEKRPNNGQHITAIKGFEISNLFKRKRLAQ